MSPTWVKVEKPRSDPKKSLEHFGTLYRILQRVGRVFGWPIPKVKAGLTIEPFRQEMRTKTGRILSSGHA
jgi:hypothetical protein